MQSPLIGISVPRQVADSAFGPRDSVLQVYEYAESVVAAGGRAVLLPSTETIPEDLLAGIDGIVLSGGGDLSPELYGESPLESTYGVSRIRDAYEIAIVEQAEKHGIPILAICRGLQLINVLRGGSLQLHIDDHWQTNASDQPLHSVDVVAGSELAEIIGGTSMQVNSYHHQAIERLGEGLTPVAFASEIVEAFEDRSKGILAVQWHPEHMYKVSKQSLALFTDLVKRAGRVRERN